MNIETCNAQLEKAFCPRWTWRAVLSGIVVTAGVYFLPPYLEVLSQPPERTVWLRTVDTMEPPPPSAPPPPRRASTGQGHAKPDRPKPQLQETRRTLAPLPARLNLEMALGNVGGDFAVDFGVDLMLGAEPVADMVFEVADLDARPRPLVPLMAVYPPQARLRKLEGFVVVEFIVGSDGTVRQAEVVSSQPGSIFREAALQAVRRWRFVPGTKDGKPVPARVRQRVTFQLH